MNIKKKIQNIKGVFIPKKYDKRRKLKEEDIKLIKLLHKEGVSIREIARRFNGKCSRSGIQYVLGNKWTRQGWKKQYDKEKHRKKIMKYRTHRRQLAKKGVLKKGAKDVLYEQFKAHYSRVLKLPRTWQELGGGAKRIYAGYLKKRISKLESGRKRKLK